MGVRAEWLGEVKAGIRKVTWKGHLQKQHCSRERSSPLCIFRVGSLSKTHPYATILLTACCLGMAGKEGRHAAPAAQGSRPAGKGRGPLAIPPSHSVAPSLSSTPGTRRGPGENRASQMWLGPQGPRHLLRERDTKQTLPSPWDKGIITEHSLWKTVRRESMWASQS